MRWPARMSGLFLSEEIDDWREGEEERSREKKECGDENAAERDVASVPAKRKQGPSEQPDSDCDGCDAGEWTGGAIEDEVPCEGFRCVSRNCKHAQREGADACGKYRGGSEAVGERAIVRVR